MTWDIDPDHPANPTAMQQRFLQSYTARLLFLLGAIIAALLIVQYRLLFKRDFHLFKANLTHLG
ncbi:hypothetical protein [Luteolibacter algae]